MTTIFLSHVEESEETAESIAQGLRAEGYGAWKFETDTLPGPTYLSQVVQAIEEASAVILIITPEALGSHQVAREIEVAHDLDRPIIPVLEGITHEKYVQRRPEWRLALGGYASVQVPPEGVTAVMPRIVGGLRAMGIVPTAEAPPASADAGSSTTPDAPATPATKERAPSPTRRAPPGGPRRWWIAAAVAAGVVLVAAAVAIGARIGGSGGGDPPRVAPGTRASQSFAGIETGDCVDDFVLDVDDVVVIVPCDQPHEMEAIYAGDAWESGDEYLGRSALEDDAYNLCAREFLRYVGEPYLDSSLIVSAYYPSEAAWADGDRRLTCLVSDDAQMEASIKDSAR